jgi:hypothetical protein
MFSWIGKKLEEGRITARNENREDLQHKLLSKIDSTGISYKLLLRFYIHLYAKSEIDAALEELVDAGEIRREGQVFHVAA